ncbi:MAG TPA: nuclear transport factor 2 family protein [Macromonas sp.]|nr:nuclear transport factor 2 family protein [Macromonas sp.]
MKEGPQQPPADTGNSRRRVLSRLAGIAIAAPAAVSTLAAERKTSAADLKKHFLGMIQAWNDHDAKKIASFFSQDSTYTDIALELTHHGKDEIIEFAEGTFKGFPDFHLVITSCVSDAQLVAAEWDMIMSWTGPYPALGAVPTGKTYTLKGASVSHFDAHGKIRQNTDYWNLQSFIKQMKSQ